MSHINLILLKIMSRTNIPYVIFSDIMISSAHTIVTISQCCILHYLENIQILKSKVSYTMHYYLRKERKKEMFYLTVHSTHFIYGYMALVI